MVVAGYAKALGAGATSGPGYGAGLVIDLVTTGASVVYDWKDLKGQNHNYVSAGLSVTGHPTVILFPPANGE